MRKIIFIFFLATSYKSFVFCSELQTLALVNNNPITNYNLYLEASYREALTGKIVSKKDTYILIETLINDEIKKIEIKSNNISKEISNEQTEKFLDQIVKKEISKEIEKYILAKIKLQTEWNHLVYLKFKNKLEINTAEINEINKNKKLSIEESNALNNQLRQKKFISLSKSFFSEVKKKYYIKKF